MTWKLCLTVGKSGHHNIESPWSDKCAACMPAGQCHKSQLCFKTQEMTMLEMLYQLMEGYRQNRGHMAEMLLWLHWWRSQKNELGEKSPSVKTESLLVVLKAHFLVARQKISSLSLDLSGQVSLHRRLPELMLVVPAVGYSLGGEELLSPQRWAPDQLDRVTATRESSLCQWCTCCLDGLLGCGCDVT